MEYKKCFIPTCINDSNNSPNIMIVRIREDLRDKWCREANAKYYKVGAMYCCEDHLDPQEDLKNYYEYKLMNREPKLKPTALLRNTAHNLSSESTTDSTELLKLLVSPASPHKPCTKKRKYDEKSMPTCSTLPVKVQVATQCKVKMTDKSTNYKARKAAATNEIPSSQETLSMATPSWFGGTTETEEDSTTHHHKELQSREFFLKIIKKSQKCI